MVQLFIPADPQGAVDALSKLGLSVSVGDVAGLVAAAAANEGGGTPTPAGLALAWPKYPGRNCYWKNHGAEEVDYPWGKAVANVKTLHACQAACVEAADFGCHGVLFQVATGNCYRKKDIVVEKCVRDESVDLYVRPSATVFVDRLE